MKHLDSTWTAVLWVSAALLVALAGTGAASTAYQRERRWLGESHFNTGEALAKTGRNSDAVEEYRKALLFSPDNEQYRLSLASALLHDGRLDESRSYLAQLQDEDPNNPLIYLDVAQIELARHQVNRAIQDYQHAVYQYWPADLVPLRRQARWKLVSLLAQNGRRNETVGELLQLYASAPPDPAEKERIGFALLQNGASSEANRIFSDLTRQYPRDASAQIGLARAEFVSGDYVSARHSFQRALRDDPHNPAGQQGLDLTNAVIDIDGSLGGISEAERVRRNGNLLRRVLADLSTCMNVAGASETAADADAAQKLLNGKHTAGEDVAFEYQQTAQQLWRERATACGRNPPADPAVDRVLTGAANE